MTTIARPYALLARFRGRQCRFVRTCDFLANVKVNALHQKVWELSSHAFINALTPRCLRSENCEKLTAITLPREQIETLSYFHVMRVTL